MIRESIKTAPTVEEAKLSALLDLGLCEDDDFQIEVLELPQKKFLGLFGGCPAKVKISVEVPDEKKPAPRKEFKKEERRKPAPQQKKPNAPAKKETAPKAETSFENPNADLKETNEFDAALRIHQNDGDLARH